MFPKIIIFEINVGYARRILTWFWVRFTIGDASSRELFKLHYVLSKCSRLIAKDIGNHAQLLIKIRRLDFSLHILLHIIHHPILLNEVALEELDHLQGHQQRNRYEIHQSKEPLHPGDNVVLPVRIVVLSVVESKVGQFGSLHIDPHTVVGC